MNVENKAKGLNQRETARDLIYKRFKEKKTGLNDFPSNFPIQTISHKDKLFLDFKCNSMPY